MTTLAAPLPILATLANHPSRASAAAIGHQYILNGEGPALRIRGLDILSNMVCDWSVTILEQAIEDPSRGFLVRQHAITKLEELTAKAIDYGYAGLTKSACRRLAREARMMLRKFTPADEIQEIQAVEDLCNHLSQAVEEGFFSDLPDF